MVPEMSYSPYGEYGPSYAGREEAGAFTAVFEAIPRPAGGEADPDRFDPDGYDGPVHAMCWLLAEGAPLGRGSHLVLDDECASLDEAASAVGAVVARAAAGEFDHLMEGE